MPQTLTVVFSGVVVMARRTRQTGYRFLFPATLPTKRVRVALDGTPLRPHFPHLVEGRKAWFPEAGRRLDFDIGATGPVFSERLDRVLRMEYALEEGRCRLDPSVFTAHPVPRIGAYVDVTHGALATGDTLDWRMDGRRLGGPDGTYPVTDEVIWSVTGLTHDVAVSAVPFRGGTAEVVTTLPTGTRDVTVRLQNFLAEDLAGQFHGRDHPHGDVDEDFRWYYQLLEGTPTSGNMAWVVKQLRGGRLPLPEKEGHTQHGAMRGLTQNCMPVLFPDQDS